MENEFLNWQLTVKMFKLSNSVLSRKLSNGFSATESREVFFHGNVYDFSVYYLINLT